MKKINLASTSPRRRDILRNLGIEFEIVKPLFSESVLNKPFSYSIIEEIATKKALSVVKTVPINSVIIGADTVVVYDSIILGKPKDYDDAIRMLKMLSGKVHKVVTAVCVIDVESRKKIVKSETSEVEFNELSIDIIKDYIHKFKPYDKAGSYGIQELTEDFVKEIKGDYENIVGLPSNLVINMLNLVGL